MSTPHFPPTALVVIDIQKGFNDPYWGKRNNPEFEENAAHTIDTFRKLDLPIFHIQHLSTEKHSPLRPDCAGVEFMPFAEPRPHEQRITKNVNSAFIGTDLELRLRKHRVAKLFLIGLTTDHCVSTSARMAANLGFKVFIPSNAVATFDRVGFDGNHYSAELIHQSALASLHREFATVLPSLPTEAELSSGLKI
jgi:nicotinamidase-related amidase